MFLDSCTVVEATLAYEFYDKFCLELFYGFILDSIRPKWLVTAAKLFSARSSLWISFACPFAIDEAPGLSLSAGELILMQVSELWLTLHELLLCSLLFLPKELPKLSYLWSLDRSFFPLSLSSDFFSFVAYLFLEDVQPTSASDFLSLLNCFLKYGRIVPEPRLFGSTRLCSPSLEFIKI